MDLSQGTNPYDSTANFARYFPTHNAVVAGELSNRAVSTPKVGSKRNRVKFACHEYRPASMKDEDCKDHMGLSHLRRQLSAGTMRPGTFRAKLDSYSRAGLISPRLADDMKRDQLNHLAARATRVERARHRKNNMLRKADEHAKIKAVERGIEGLGLGLKMDTSHAKSPTLQPFLLTLSYVSTIITDPADAKTAFDHFQKSFTNPGYMDKLSGRDRKLIRVLFESETALQSIVHNTGSVEAAMMHQDERVAFFEERTAVRKEFLEEEEGLSDDLDEDFPLRGEPFIKAARMSRDSAISFSHLVPQPGALHEMTDKQKAADEQTAEDLKAYQQNPNLRVLNKKRWKRLQTALNLGRTDLCARELERKRMGQQAFKQREKRRMAEQGAHRSDLGARECMTASLASGQGACRSDLYRPAQDTRDDM
ncbi:MAG: hypothetical protein L6R40_000853 [Gallowayella cf. fulva]|nr:MAG: hypothetical protein L6R40_000853 [Xanthomendoza cf. fulva]